MMIKIEYQPIIIHLSTGSGSYRGKYEEIAPSLVKDSGFRGGGSEIVQDNSKVSQLMGPFLGFQKEAQRAF
jgi:hypothetical protein